MAINGDAIPPTLAHALQSPQAKLLERKIDKLVKAGASTNGIKPCDFSSIEIIDSSCSKNCNILGLSTVVLAWV